MTNLCKCGEVDLGARWKVETSHDNGVRLRMHYVSLCSDIWIYNKSTDQRLGIEVVNRGHPRTDARRYGAKHAGLWALFLVRVRQLYCRHEWYNLDDERSRCYRCVVIRQGKLWLPPRLPVGKDGGNYAVEKLAREALAGAADETTEPPAPVCTCKPPEYKKLSEGCASFSSGVIDPKCPIHWRLTMIQNDQPENGEGSR